MTIQSLGIIGAGTMGNGIAQVSAQAGLDVLMLDVSDAALASGMTAIAGSLERLVRKEKISAADKGSILGRINVTTKIAGFAAVDYCIEAATENETIKLKILPDADRVLRPEAIIATNTSSISITRLAVATGLLHVRLIRADQPPAQWMSSLVADRLRCLRRPVSPECA